MKPLNLLLFPFYLCVAISAYLFYAVLEGFDLAFKLLHKFVVFCTLRAQEIQYAIELYSHEKKGNDQSNHEGCQNIGIEGNGGQGVHDSKGGDNL